MWSMYSLRLIVSLKLPFNLVKLPLASWLILSMWMVKIRGTLVMRILFVAFFTFMVLEFNSSLWLPSNYDFWERYGLSWSREWFRNGISWARHGLSWHGHGARKWWGSDLWLILRQKYIFRKWNLFYFKNEEKSKINFLIIKIKFLIFELIGQDWFFVLWLYYTLATKSQHN